MKALVFVAYFIEMQDSVRRTREVLQYFFDKGWRENGVGVANDAILSLRQKQSQIVEAMLVEDGVLIVAGHQPLVDDRRLLFLPKHHVLEHERLAIVKFQPDDLILVARRRLLIQVMQAMKTLAHAPIQEDNAELAIGLGPMKDEFRARHRLPPQCR